MSGIISRRRFSEGAAPTFVDYIWPDVGVPEIAITIPSGRTRVVANIAFRSAIPNDNNGLITLIDSNNNGTTAYIQDKIFRLWHARTSTSRNTGVTASPLTNYYVVMTPNTQLSGFTMGVDNAGWTTGVPIDNYVRIRLSVSGSHVVPAAYARCNVYNRTGGSGDLTYDHLLDLRPCIYKGEYGMWDDLRGTFHGNTVEGASWTGGSVS